MELIKKVQNFFSYWYLRYLLATELYMVETWERVVFHVLFIILFSLVWYFNYSIVVSSIAQLRGTTNRVEQIL